MTAIAATSLRDCVDRAADVLVDTAVAVGATSSWLGVEASPGGEQASPTYRTGEATLYDGTAGIAMAAWSVAVALQRDDLASTALGAARHAASAQERLATMGLFDGLAGIGLAALEIGDDGNDRRLRAAGLEILARVAAAPPADTDLISGSAGVALALLRAAHRTGSKRWLAAATGHGEYLLAAANRHPWGWGWPLASFGGRELCGLAHGAAGIAWSLGALAAAVDDVRFLEAADGALRFERSWFQRKENNWPDLRAQSDAAEAPVACPAFWCHGATGIGLARLALSNVAGHPTLVAEATSALQSATSAASRELDSQPAAGLTICHGLGGTLLLLVAASQTLREAAHLAAARWLAGRALAWLGDDPWLWPSGVPSGGFSPGLMTGLAGAMYTLSRVAEPERTETIPVLADQGPRPARHP